MSTMSKEHVDELVKKLVPVSHKELVELPPGVKVLEVDSRGYGSWTETPLEPYYSDPDEDVNPWRYYKNK